MSADLWNSTASGLSHRTPHRSDGRGAPGSDAASESRLFEVPHMELVADVYWLTGVGTALGTKRCRSTTSRRACGSIGFDT